jgi:F-type H+-transporting ATPase subunit b
MKEPQEKVEQKPMEGKKKVEAELQKALASMEQQKVHTIKALDEKNMD